MNIFMIITFALQVLTSLESYTCSNLQYYAKHTTVFKRLQALLELFQKQTAPVVTLEGIPYFLFSQDFLKKHCEAGGTTERWQSHKVWLKDAGLIETMSVSGPSDNPTLNRIWETAQAKKQEPETLWTIPLYTAELLQQAEQIASRYRELHLSISHLRKNTMIRFYGQRRADWLYSDYRVMSNEEKLLLRFCREVIQNRIATAGFTTFKEVATGVRALYAGRQSYEQRLLELLNPLEKENPTLDLILQDKHFLCNECGCVYRQINKADRSNLAIPTDLRSWIITPA